MARIREDQTADHVRLNGKEDDLDVSRIQIRINPRNPRLKMEKEGETADYADGADQRRLTADHVRLKGREDDLDVSRI